MINISRALHYLKKSYENPTRAIEMVRENGLLSLLARCIAIPARNNKIPPSLLDKLLNNLDKKHFVILTTKHCLFIAKLIQKKLNKVGIESEIIFEKPSSGYSDKLHIVICPQLFTSLPNLYIAYQLEQSVSGRWFDERYFRILNNSLAILDYSTQNITFLKKHKFSYKQLFYVPIFSKDIETSSTYEYDIIFYGDTRNPRRKEILEKLKQKFKVKIINGLFGDDLYKELKKAKIVLNLHYYDGALLESTRIFESLSLGKLVISEDAVDQADYHNIQGIVEFVKTNDYETLESKLLEWLNLPDFEFNTRLSNKLDRLAQQFDIFEFYFYRMLLNFDLITFDQFYYTIGQHVKLPTASICLSLKETPERQEYFKSVDTIGCYIFQGLRHHKSWVGCGLSYKFLMMRAKYQNFPEITICEDDVVFPKDFPKRLYNIKKYLSECSDWSIFNGLMTDVHPETKIFKVSHSENETLLYVDRLISAVFNIYDSSAYDSMIQWNYLDHNVESNTFDRYLQRSAHLKVVVCLPFLVGHQEQQISTLWNFQNSNYNKLIQKSETILKTKVNEYDAKNTT